MKLFKKVENSNEYWHSNDYCDEELKFKMFKLKLADFSIIVEENMFE